MKYFLHLIFQLPWFPILHQYWRSIWNNLVLKPVFHFPGLEIPGRHHCSTDYWWLFWNTPWSYSQIHLQFDAFFPFSNIANYAHDRQHKWHFCYPISQSVFFVRPYIFCRINSVKQWCLPGISNPGKWNTGFKTRLFQIDLQYWWRIGNQGNWNIRWRKYFMQDAIPIKNNV